MNLFVTSPSAGICAQSLDDQRLIKAVLETAQLLSTNLGMGLRPTHTNHPVTLWVGRSQATLCWTLRHFFALNFEYSHRFLREHKLKPLMGDFAEAILNRHHTLIHTCPDTFQNSARNAKLGLDFSHKPVFSAYQDYMNAKWHISTPRFTRALPPIWCSARTTQLKMHTLIREIGEKHHVPA